MNIRIGNGYDIHKLVADRPLILGGIEIPHSLGLLGHSDADVLTHAIMDALLGALGLGDIGHYFPPSDPKWKGANSMMLLEQVLGIIQGQGWQIGNIDSTIVAEQPKLKPHLKTMRNSLAETMSIELDRVSIKATTNEKLDAVGQEAGICAYAVVLLVAETE
ncbi:MAG: 2-C-methyl-D-erythritol 2,4-cyclodiphosphate synthase [Cyanobacteria bacterium J06623_7]